MVQTPVFKKDYAYHFAAGYIAAGGGVTLISFTINKK
jgi:hypothetical protein